MTILPRWRSRRRCRHCVVPRTFVARVEAESMLPSTWQSIDLHPRIRPGVWVPGGHLRGVVYCEACEALWWLELDPDEGYYTDLIQMAPELEAVLSEDAELQDLLSVALEGDDLLHPMVRDWFGSADYDPSEGAQWLVESLKRRRLPLHRALRTLSLLETILDGSNPHHRKRMELMGEPRYLVVLRDLSPLALLGSRGDLRVPRHWDRARRAVGREELSDQVSTLVRLAFGTAFGGEADLVSTKAEDRADLIALARRPRVSTPYRSSSERGTPAVA